MKEKAEEGKEAAAVDAQPAQLEKQDSIAQALICQICQVHCVRVLAVCQYFFSALGNSSRLCQVSE